MTALFTGAKRCYVQKDEKRIRHGPSASWNSSSLKMNAETQKKNLEDVMLSGMGWAQKDKYCVTPLTGDA